MRPLLIAVLAILTLPDVTNAQTCGADRYPLVCNGPVGVSRNLARAGNLVIHKVIFDFLPGDRAAGPDGAALPAGMCSWSDRAMSEAEGNMLRTLMEISTDADGRVIRTLLHADILGEIQRCNAAAACRFALCAQSVSGTLQSDLENLRVSYP